MNKQFHLTSDEKQDLRDIVTHHGWDAFIKDMYWILADIENKVVTTRVEAGKENEIVYAKLRAEGAKELFNSIKNRSSTLRSND